MSKNRLTQVGKVAGWMVAGSALRDLSPQWNGLSAWLRFFLIAFPILMAALAASLLITVVFNLGGGSVLLSANTEYVEYTALSDDPAILLLPDATITVAPPQESDEDIFGKTVATDESEKSEDSTAATVSPDYNLPVGPNFLELNCGDELLFSRVGRGPLVLQVSRLSTDINQGGGIIDASDNYVKFEKDLPPDFTIEINNTDDYFEKGISLSWQLSGLIVVGRPVDIAISTERGLLLDGYVEVFANNLIGDGGNHIVDQFELGVGDQVLLDSTDKLLVEKKRLYENRDNPSVQRDICRRIDARDKGFVHLNGQAALDVKLSSDSDFATIERFQVANLKIGKSWTKRILNDKLISLLWAVIIAFFILYRRVLRSFLALSGEKND